jgi:hypothetical protein
MRDAFAFVERYFRGGYLDLPVDLDRIAVDDLAVEVQCDFNSECAFAGCSRANDGDDRVHMRKSITAQMRASSRSAPTSWLREKFMDRMNRIFTGFTCQS